MAAKHLVQLQPTIHFDDPLTETEDRPKLGISGSSLASKVTTVEEVLILLVGLVPDRVRDDSMSDLEDAAQTLAYRRSDWPFLYMTISLIHILAATT